MNFIINYFLKASGIGLLAVLLSLESHGQEIIFVKDSIMEVYMKNGYANKHFRPRGKEDTKTISDKEVEAIMKSQKTLRMFHWMENPNKYSEIFCYIWVKENKGRKREGTWKFFVIEDKPFKKILQQKVWYENGVNREIYYFSKKLGVKGKYVSNELGG